MAVDTHVLVVADGDPPGLREPRARRRARLAIAGGVNLSLHPNKYLVLAQGSSSPATAAARASATAATATCPARAWARCVLKPLDRARSRTATTSTASSAARAQPRRQDQRLHRAQPAGAGGRHPPRAREGAASTARRSATSRRTAPAPSWAIRSRSRRSRKAFRADTPDTGFCAHRLGEVEHRPLRERGRHRRADQGAAADAAPAARAVAALRGAEPAHRFRRTPFVVQRQLGEWQRPVAGRRRKCRASPASRRSAPAARTRT